MRKKLVVKSSIILGFSLIIGLTFFTDFARNIIETVRTTPETECVVSLIDGDVFHQELQLEHTPRIYVDFYSRYEEVVPEAGILYSLKMGDAIESGFFSLSEFKNDTWESFAIETNNFKFVGTATLTLEAVALDNTNAVGILLVTNTENNPQLSLWKDATKISSGMISLSHANYCVRISLLGYCISFIMVATAYFLFLNKRRIQYVKDHPALFATVAVFVIQLIYSYRSLFDINLHTSTQYTFSWQNLGFQKRGLLGSIIELLNINFDVNAYVAWGIFLNVLLLTTELWLLYQRKDTIYDKNMEKAYWLFLCTPFSIISIFGMHFFARLDLLLIIFFLLSCIVLIKGRALWLIPMIAIVGELVHQMYVAMFLPFLFVLILYKWYVTRSKKYLFTLGMTIIAALGLGIFFTFQEAPLKSMEDAWQYIQVTYDSNLIFDYGLRINYYTSFIDFIKEGVRIIIAVKTVPKALASMLLLAPVIWLAGRWLKEYHAKQTSAIGKLIVMLFPCTVAGLFVGMIVSCDWGRWFYMYGVCVFFSLLTLWRIDSNNVHDTLKSVWLQACSRFGHNLIICLCIFYMFASAIAGGASSTTLFEWINQAWPLNGGFLL